MSIKGPKADVLLLVSTDLIRAGVIELIQDLRRDKPQLRFITDGETDFKISSAKCIRFNMIKNHKKTTTTQ